MRKSWPSIFLVANLQTKGTKDFLIAGYLEAGRSEERFIASKQKST